MLMSVCGPAHGAMSESLVQLGLSVRTLNVSTASPMMQAIDRLASVSEDPAQTRGTLLARMMYGTNCYRGDLTAAEWEQVFQQTKFLPPGVTARSDRFYPDAFCWLGDGGQGSANTSRRARLTYSFPPDGTVWGLACQGFNSAPSVLDTALTTQFGTLDRGREFIRSALASWRRYGGLTYAEVADDGSPQDLSVTRDPNRGDVRIGGIPLGTGPSAPLASDTFPSNLGFTGCSGGDMLINTSFFTPSYLGSVQGNFLYFRNTIAHEHGHGLGYRHSVPCDRTKLMEPSITTVFTLQTLDEIRGAAANYGDRFSGNQNATMAQDFGDLTVPTLRSVIERDLATNGTVVNVDTQQVPQHDWYKFTLSSARTVTITVTPTGLTYENGVQSTGCTATGSTVFVNALQAGNLSLQLLSAAQVVLQESSSGGPGIAETVTATLNPGTYLVRVWDIGGTPAANQVVQTYDLTIDVAGALAPPKAIAGINKRVRAGTTCQFIGNHNSYANDASASIPPGNYAWDLDGNGSFESTGNSQPTQTYPSNGVYNVTLRVTDSNGLTATDTIQVTVFGATTSVASVSPASGALGTTVPVVITGANFRGVTNASQVSVSGGGVTVTGTPSVNALGTQISGLSFVISAGAAGTARDVTVTNADGSGSSGTGLAKFQVNGGETGACCASNGVCSVGSPGSCVSGTYQGASTTCSPNPCPQPTGACCSGSTCSVTTQASCAGANTRFAGAGVACNAVGNNSTPCCKADFNASESISVQDVFDFLSAWFGSDPQSDFNGSGITVQDVFDFLAAWFIGCP